MASSFSSPWPDPNSPVLSKIDFGIPLVDVLLWLQARDTFLGHNYKCQDIKAALALARDCKHPDAEWLTSIFEGKDVSTKKKVREVFLSIQDDARALCFAWFMSPVADNSLLTRASDMGYAFASSTLSTLLEFENKVKAFCLAQISGSQHERDGFYFLGRFLRGGIGCEEDLNLGQEKFLLASELGLIWAAAQYGNLLNESDPFRWLWFGRAALCGSPDSFLDSFSQQVERFFSGSGNATIVFLIGRTLKGNINVEKKQIFGTRLNFDSRIGPANQAVSFFESQIKSARLAVDAWIRVSIRLHLIRDMRIYITKMIWEGRFEANYKI